VESSSGPPGCSRLAVVTGAALSPEARAVGCSRRAAAGASSPGEGRGTSRSGSGTSRSAWSGPVAGCSVPPAGCRIPTWPARPPGCQPPERRRRYPLSATFVYAFIFPRRRGAAADRRALYVSHAPRASSGCNDFTPKQHRPPTRQGAKPPSLTDSECPCPKAARPRGRGARSRCMPTQPRDR
jgi:hypothetical protein